MNRLPTFLILGALTGCSNSGPTLPTCTVPEVTVVAQTGIDTPPFPEEVSSSSTTATFDLEGLQQFQRVRIAAKTNEEIANKNAEALDARKDEINALRTCNDHQIQWMEMREEQLEQERSDHSQDNWFHRGVILLMGILYFPANIM